MTRRCKPGQRARIIGCGSNRGQVVVVVRHYLGELVNGAHWPLAVFPWVVLSLGRPLASEDIETGKPAPPAMSIVLDDSELQPLSDDDGLGADECADQQAAPCVGGRR